MKSEIVVENYGALTLSSSAGGTSTYSVPVSRRFLNVVNGETSPKPGRFNTYSFQKYRYFYGRGSSLRHWVDGGGNYQTTTSAGITDMVSPPDGVISQHPSTYYQEVQDRVLEKIFGKIRGQSNLVVDLAESRQTLKMLKATISLRSLIRDFFRGLIIPKKLRSRTSGQARLDYVTSKWLEWRYGWQPIIYSIYDAAATLQGEHLSARVQPVKARSGKVYGGYVKNVSSSPTSEVHTNEFNSVRCEMVVLFRYSPLHQVADFTSLSPYAIAWELMPLSFVADWVWNVSQLLELWENWTLFAPYFEGGYRTFSHKIARNRYYWVTDTRTPIESDPDRPGYALPNPNGVYSAYEQSRFIETAKSRSNLTSLPTPGLVRMRFKLNANRQLDAAALLHQLVAKRMR